MATLYLTVLKSRRNLEGKLPIFVAVKSKRQVCCIKSGYEIYNLFELEHGEVVCRKDAKCVAYYFVQA